MLPKQIPKVKKVSVLIDYANILSSALSMKKHTNMEILYEYLVSIPYIKKITIYYGTNPRNPKSANFIKSLEKIGYEVVTKNVKFIKINIHELVRTGQNKDLLDRLDKKVVNYFLKEVDKLGKHGYFLEQPKCNLDIEIALDMFQSFSLFDGFILFSGDGDFSSITKLARASGKHVTVVALRKFLAGELFQSANCYINFMLFKNLKGFLYNPSKK